MGIGSFFKRMRPGKGPLPHVAAIDAAYTEPGGGGKVPRTNPKSDPYYARWSYERLLLLQPQVKTGGLWKMDRLFYAVCPDLEAGLLAQDGSPLAHWFNESGRALGAPIQLVAAHPEGAEPVPERSLAERIQLHGEPLTVRDLYAELAIQMPQAFPEFVLNVSASTATVFVPRALSEVEQSRLENAFNGFGFEIRLTVSVDPAKFNEPRPFRDHLPRGGDISLMPSRHIRSRCPKDMLRIWEEDEDFWVENRVRIITEDWRDPARCLPGHLGLIPK